MTIDDRFERVVCLGSAWRLSCRQIHVSRLDEYDHDLFHPENIAPAPARVVIKMCLGNAKRLLTLAATAYLSGVSRKSVTDSDFCSDEPRRIFVGLEFFAQMSDVNAKILRLALGLFSPDRAKQLTMGYNFSSVLHQDAQQRVLGRR